MYQIIDQQTIDILLQLLLATFLGALIGGEREVHGKSAGLRTYTLVTLGACLFTVLSIYGFQEFSGVAAYDPSRIASQVVVGIGFIGGGLIFLRGEAVQGLTTAAGLWISAAVGMAIAVRMYWVAIFAALIAIFVLRVLKKVEPYLRKNDEST